MLFYLKKLEEKKYVLKDLFGVSKYARVPILFYQGS